MHPIFFICANSSPGCDLQYHMVSHGFVNISWGNGLPSIRRQAITSANDGSSSIRPYTTNSKNLN